MPIKIKICNQQPYLSNEAMIPLLGFLKHIHAVKL
jgi:hypothetical protein